MPEGQFETGREKRQSEFDAKFGAGESIRLIDAMTQRWKPSLGGLKVAPETGVNPQPGWNNQRENSPGGWSIGVFQDKDKLLPPLPQPKPGVNNEPLFLGVPEPIVKTGLSDYDVRRSAAENANGRQILLTGALAGAGTQAAVWALDTISGRTPADLRTGWQATWRSSFSPSQRLVPGFEAATVQAQDRATQVYRQVALTESGVTGAAGLRTTAIDRLRAEIPAGTLAPLEQRFFNARVDLLTNDAHFNRVNILANAGTEAQVAARQRLFTVAEADVLAQHADDYWTAVSRRTTAQAAMRQAEAARDLAVGRLNAARGGSYAPLGDSVLRGMGQGLGIAALTVTADLALDKMMGNDPALKGLGSWGLQGIGMPALLMSNAPGWMKVAGSLGLVAGSHLLDREFGPPRGIFSVVGRPSIPEVALTTTAALAPIPDKRIKAGLVVGSWLAGRVWNAVNDKYEITGKTPQKIESDARGQTMVYMQNPSVANFAEATAGVERFAQENQAAAALLVGDFQNTHAGLPPCELMRGRAALLVGVADHKLEAGTRFDGKEYDWGERIGAGHRYDLGGEAASFYRYALNSVDRAQEHARANLGQTVNGRVVDPVFVNHFDELRRQVNVKLDQIYGEHDVNQIVQEAQSKVRSHPQQMKNFGERLRQHYETLTDKDKPYKAKIARDLALVHLAFARSTSDASFKSDHYTFARRYLADSRNLQVTPDQRKLEDLLSA